MKNILAILLTILIFGGACFGGWMWYNHNHNNNNSAADQLAQAYAQKNELEGIVSILQDENLSLQEKQEILQQQNQNLHTKINELNQKIIQIGSKKIISFNADVVKEEIKNISELATVEYCYTNVGVLDSSLQFSFIEVEIPFSDKKLIVTMDGRIKAGIDLTKAEITSDEKSKTITVKLPASEILTNELIEDSLESLVENNSAINPITMDDTNEIRKQIKEKAAEQALSKNHILEQADAHAQQLIRNIIEAVPGVKGTYEIIFETK